MCFEMSQTVQVSTHIHAVNSNTTHAENIVYFVLLTV
jgi:hypothetical protein